MPTAVSYPGVYVEEIPSGVRTITGVSTSITAFAGWLPKGPTDRAQRVLSWSDFERRFGGLNTNSLVSYAVRHFFDNGGSDAYIVRLAAANAAAATVTLDSKLKISARNPGLWGNKLAVTSTRNTTDNTRFSLTILQQDPEGVFAAAETHFDLSINATDKRFVQRVIDSNSNLIAAEIVGSPTTPPADSTSTALQTGADGTVLTPDTSGFESKLQPTNGLGGVFFLDRIDLFNLLCVPGETTPAVISLLQKFCRDRRAFLICDSEPDADVDDLDDGPDSAITGNNAINSAFYFPWISAPDPLAEGRPRAFPPSGFVAGLYARTDAGPGVWKAPAGTEVSLTGINGPMLTLTDAENGLLNPKAVNCIRTFPVYGTVVWGARTLRGNDEAASEWKYVPVRRLALFLEESLYRGTQWAVFEPNDEPLWAQLRLNIGAFMHDMFRKGAFAGATPREAYFVKCDRETTTQSDVNQGIVNVVIGFAPLKPAEFVILKFQQMAGQIAT